MELSVAVAQKQVGEPFPFEISEAFGPIPYGGRTVDFAAPVRVYGTFVFDGKAFTVAAEAETILKSVCARCAKPFDEPLAFPVNAMFVKAAEASGDTDAYPYTGDTLDVTKAVLDEFFLSLPLVSECRPDCKGLCPVCGCDRNVQTCHCQPTEAQSAFAALSALSDKE